jgi:NAD(P)-dependent dehydrogenase (short-subunit alcohol dehydrogenase family)
MSRDLAGKTILVTGATEGIGKAASLDFARRGARLVLVGRNKEKTERVVAELKSESGNDAIDLLLGDLSRVADVREVARAFRARHDRLDVLVNNAGALFDARRLTSEGIEMTFALNHVGYFVLTTELLDLLRATPNARIISTSSGAHTMGKLDFDDVALRERGLYWAFGVYGTSKLANILFTRELARRLEGTSVTANCFHPGWVHTGFGQNTMRPLAAIIDFGATLLARTPERGARTLIWLAGSTEVEGVTGQYFHDERVARTSRPARDAAMAAKLWDFTERLVASV